MGCNTANGVVPGDGTEVGFAVTKDKVAKRLIRRLEELGLTVDVRAAS